MPLFRTLVVALALAVLAAAPARAGEVSESWTTVSTTGPLTDTVNLYAEVVIRSDDDFDGLRQTQLRGVVSAKVADGLRIGMGLVRSETHMEGRPNAVETRPFPQVDWTIGTLLGGELSSRTRMEVRLRSDGRDTSYRVRQQVRYLRPLGQGLPNLRLTEEAFFELKDTDGRDNSGYALSRLSAGLQFKLNDHLSIEPGYLAEIGRVRSGPNLTRHVVNLSIATSF